MGPCAPPARGAAGAVGAGRRWRGERRAPTIGAALLPTGSGPAPTRLLVIRRGDCRPGADTTVSWRHDGGRTGKKINVSGVPAREQKSVFKFQQHRSREWGHWCPLSIL